MKKLNYFTKNSQKKVFVFLSLFYLNFIFLGYEAQAQNSGYVSKNAPIGGGGFVTGIVTHKTSGERYCRTDVGGAYRWDAVNNKWIQLMDWLNESELGFIGVESLALDPQNANNIYMLCGTEYLSNGKTGILKSTDKGNTFTYVDVTNKFKTHGNGGGRSNGERLAVDPKNSNILYCGTRSNGLWKSTDAGITWNLAWNGVTSTANANGICFVLFDPSSSIVNGVSQTIYVGVSRTGGGTLYRSTNGGVSFTDISPTTSFMPHRAALQGTTMYVTYANGEGPNLGEGSGKIYKFNTSTGAWTNVTPAHSKDYPYGGVSIDPTNVNRVIVSTCGMYWNNQFGNGWGDFVFITTDGGSTWNLKNGSNSTYDANGMAWSGGGAINWMDCIEFDQDNLNRVRVIGGGGVFTCPDITATNTSWKYDVVGIEETALLDGVSIPGGPFISSFGDVRGFVHDPLTSVPSKTLYSSAPGEEYNNNSIAYAAGNPNKVVRVGNGGSVVYYSNDKGTTWTGTPSKVGSAGRVSVSADGATILHCPWGSSTTSYSTNNGVSWSNCSGVSVGDAAPIADQVNSNNFYIFSPRTGQFFRSTNKGVSFSEVSTPGVSTADHPWESVLARTVPGREGHIWIPLGNNGLKYSTNAGATYTTVANVTYCKSIGIGVTMSGASYPTVFIWGTVSGVTGLFRSTNQGATWLRVNDNAHQFAGAPLLIGDMNTAGRVFMSAGGGRGLIYWEPTSCSPTAITAYTQINGGAWQQTANVSLNAGGNVMIGPQPATGGSWSWTGPNGFSASTREIYISNIQTNQAGNYVATYTNTGGCQSSQTFNITVNIPCTPTVIVPYLQIDGGTWQQTATASLAAGGTLMVGPQPTTGGSWSWSGPNGFSASTREIYISNIQTNQAGNYVSTYTNANGCSSTQNFAVTVNGSIVVRARGSQGTETIDLRVNGSTVATWTLTTSYQNYSANGSGTVTVHFINDDTGRDVQIDNVIIGGVTYQSENQQVNTGVWTTTCGGANSEWLNCNGYISYTTSSSSAKISTVKSETAINPENTLHDVILYPNPSYDGIFQLSIPWKNLKTNILIFNTSGNLIYQQLETGKEQVIVNSKLKKGVYLVKIQSEKATVTRKLIVE